ncbi:hypothetical protein RRG08_038180 [Elysia crispata]|uniref:Uncharacterized protein n=1 Tax=Elysia crispata TaxID=231223 RepID=A0AAE1AN09_9GAST|nr:hypothetical protein RRG08_038180 [Elysia crispata]
MEEIKRNVFLCPDLFFPPPVPISECLPGYRLIPSVEVRLTLSLSNDSYRLSNSFLANPDNYKSCFSVKMSSIDPGSPSEQSLWPQSLSNYWLTSP